MALLQEFKLPTGTAFGVLAERILDIVLNSSRQRMEFETCFDQKG